MAESIFRSKVQMANLSDSIVIDSAGTGNWHVGENPDPRTIRVLAENNIHVYSRARQFRAKDFQVFDHIIATDLANQADLLRWESSNPDKISLMMEWQQGADTNVVPDPYYGDFEDFRKVYNLLDGATSALLDNLTKNFSKTRTK